jgi:hypothetical protein
MGFGVAQTRASEMHAMRAQISGPLVSDPDYVSFLDLAKQFSAEADNAPVKQKTVRDIFQKDLNSLVEYLAADYCADRWKNFDPASAAALVSVRSDQ